MEMQIRSRGNALKKSRLKKLCPALLFLFLAAPAFGEEEYFIGQNILITDDGRCLSVEGKPLLQKITVKSMSGDLLTGKGSCQNGKVENTFYTYYENGSLKSEIPFRNGKLNGLVKLYQENSRLQEEVVVKDGQRHGKGKAYRENGKPLVTLNYQNNRVVSGTCHQTNGVNAPLMHEDISNLNSGAGIECP